MTTSNLEPNETQASKGFWANVAKPFKTNWSETLHYLAISAAIFISGVWAVYTYSAFEQRDAALQELRSAQTELEKTEVELEEIQKRIEGTYSSNIKIDTEYFDFDSGNGFGLVISVSAKNVGTKDLTLDLNKAPLSVSKLKYAGDKVIAEYKLKPEYYHRISDAKDKKHIKFSSQYISVGAIKIMEFFVHVDGPGVYHVAFEANVDHEQVARLAELSKRPLWFASKYIHIE